MKPSTNYLHVFLWLFLCLPCSIFASSTVLEETVSNGEKIVRSNWPAAYMGTDIGFIVEDVIICPLYDEDCLEEMNDNIPIKTIEERPCIKRDNSGFIEIGLSFEVQAAAYAQYHPEIYLRYNVGGNTGIISESSMQQSGYTFSRMIRVNLSSFQPGQLFQYTFELVTKNANNYYVPYPVDDYPNLFVKYDEVLVLGLEPGQGAGAGDKTVVTGWKSLCSDRIRPRSPLQSDNSNRLIFQQNKLSATTSSTLATDRTSEINVKATPNPFTHQLTLEGDITENTIIQLFDMQGKIIYHENLTHFAGNSPKMIDTSSFLPGMYYCQLKNATSSQTIKVIKQ